jgi:hypothetical protein
MTCSTNRSFINGGKAICWDLVALPAHHSLFSGQEYLDGISAHQEIIHGTEQTQNISKYICPSKTLPQPSGEGTDAVSQISRPQSGLASPDTKPISGLSL